MSIGKVQKVTLDKVIVKKLFGYLNYDIDFRTDKSDLSIFIAPNGCGKTTIFRLISFVFNPCSSTYKMISEVPFESFTCVLSNEKTITLIHKKKESIKITDDDEMIDEIYQEQLRRIDRYYNEMHSETWSLTINNRTIKITIRPEYFGYREEYSGDRFSLRNRNPQGIDRELIKFRDFLIENDCALAVFTIGTNRINNIDFIQSDTWPIRFGEEDRSNRSTLERVHKWSASITRLLQRNFGMYIQNAQRNLAWKYLDQTAIDADFKSFEKRWSDYRSEIAKYSSILSFCNLEDIIKPSHYKNFESIYNEKCAFLELYLIEFGKALQPIREEFPKYKLLKDLFDERNKSTQKTLAFSETGIKILQGGKEIPLDKLSSGEKNDLIMFYLLIFIYNRKNVVANTRRGRHSISNDALDSYNEEASGCLVLIDEPEISLHIEWQESYLDYLIKIQAMNDFQSIVATHSPNIVNDHCDLIVKKW